MILKYSHVIPAVSLSLACIPAMAQLQPAGPSDYSNPATVTTPTLLEPTSVRSIEFNAGGDQVSNGYGNWRDETLLGTYQIDQHVLQMELSSKEEFGVAGAFAGLADTVTINPDWFGRISIGAGDGAFYLPRIRSDIALSKKWLEQKNLITSVGLGFYEAPDGHIDRSLNFGGAYYFAAPWIIEGGLRLNKSDPGSISTHQQFVAVTYGHDKENVVTARYGWGGEGYQALAENVAIVDFQSSEASLAWRHWLTIKLGLSAKLDYYSNPYYQRKGANIGIFYQF